MDPPAGETCSARSRAPCAPGGTAATALPSAVPPRRRSGRVVGTRTGSARRLTGSFAGIEQARAASFLRRHVAGVAQWTLLQRQATTADTAVELVAQAQQVFDAVVQLRPPRRGKPTPVGGGGRAVVRQRVERLADRRQRQPE